MAQAGRAKDLYKLNSVWTSLPRKTREQEAALLTYSRHLRDLGEYEAAQTHIRNALNKSWSDTLVYEYGLLDCQDPIKQLSHAEAWTKHHSRDAKLLLSLGRICKRAQLWGKSRIYFESSIDIEPLPESYKELGELLEHQLGDKQLAEECYRKGLKLSVEGVAEPFLRLSTPSSKLKQTAPTPASVTGEDLYTV